MALFDDASLVVTPNGYKAGTLYSIKPTSGAGDMTVVRATTATRVNSAGLIESVAINVPRLDYTDSTCPRLLLEPQRINLLTYSEQFDNAIYLKGNVTATANSETAPNGTLTAETITGNGTSSLHSVIQNYSIVSGTTYTTSIYAKKGTNNFVQILGSSVIYPATVFANFDLENGVVGSVGAATTSSIQSVGNGWYRCSMTATATATVSSAAFFVILINNASSGRAEVNTLATSVYLWGAQLEQGSYPTSYIPTTTAAVTRNADAISKTGISSLINSTEGVLYAEINALKDPVDVNNWLTITDGTNANSVGIVFETNGKATGRIEVGGVGQASITTSVDYSNFIKVAFKYKENDFAWWVNGVEVGTDLSGITFPSNTLNSLQFAYGSGSNKWVGNVKLLAVFNEALSDSELETLTTI